MPDEPRQKPMTFNDYPWIKIMIITDDNQYGLSEEGYRAINREFYELGFELATKAGPPLLTQPTVMIERG